MTLEKNKTSDNANLHHLFKLAVCFALYFSHNTSSN